MTLNFERWPFALPNTRLPEEDKRWWSECYIPNPAEEIIDSRSQWCVLLGGYQSGKSTALAALRRSWKNRALVIEDEYFSDPDGHGGNEGSILQRILSQASWDLRNHLTKRPTLLALLSQTQLEFLRWAIEKFNGYRAYMRWLDGLPLEFEQRIQGIEFEDIYPTLTESRDVQGQIEELVNLCNRLGFQRILVTIDTHPFPTSKQIQEIHNMLGWLEPMQHIGLKVVIALPPPFNEREILEQSRGRVSVVPMKSSPDIIQTIISRYLSVGTEKTVQSLDQLCTTEMANQLQRMIADEFSNPSLGGWVKMTEILLELASKVGKNLPLDISFFPEVKHLFFIRFMPIHIGPDTVSIGTWRGYKWIPLDRAIYDFLATLISNKGRTVDHTVASTTKSNLHTLARRLRVAIEPDPSRSIYLRNLKGEGYWLENFVSQLINL